MRERRYFVIAEKYGQSPAQVREWSDYDLQRALMHLEAESGGNKVTADDVKTAKESRPMSRPGYVLDLPYEHWQKFITNGQLDEAKLVEGNYSPEQFGYIQEEVSKLGWFESGKAEGADYDTGPLESSEEQA